MSAVRTRGLKLQRKLYDAWSGPPTTELLRISSATSNSLRRDRWRQRLAEGAQVELPSEDDEAKNLGDADKIYEIMTNWAIEQTREHVLLFEENKNYGFARNLLAIRPFGLLVSLVCIAALVINLLLVGPAPAVIIGLIVCVATLAAWYWFPTQERVRQAGLRYAVLLFNAATR